MGEGVDDRPPTYRDDVTCGCCFVEPHDLGPLVGVVRDDFTYDDFRMSNERALHADQIARTESKLMLSARAMCNLNSRQLIYM